MQSIGKNVFKTRGTSKNEKWVAVFGSGTVPEGHPVYQMAERCGFALAQAGFGVLTGGYFGVMEAASRGAQRAGGRVVGVPCTEFARDRTHPYADTWVWTERYEERLITLVHRACAYLVLAGGIGTLSELFFTWSLMIARPSFRKPLIIIGDAWKPFLTWLEQENHVNPEDMKLIHFYPKMEDAIEFLIDTFPNRGANTPVMSSVSS